MKKGIALIASVLALSAATAQNAVDYSVSASRTYPAAGEQVEALGRVRITLDRGFGVVGYDASANSTKVYLENAAGERIPLVNAVKFGAVIDPAWKLDEASDIQPSKYTDVHAYKDVLYNMLFTRRLGWNGGDGVFTVGLPGGHVYWTFNDSFYGVVGGARNRLSCSFPRNTIMAQSADDEGYPITKEAGLHWLSRFQQTDDPNKEGYYKAYTHLDHPKAQNYNGDGIAQDYLYWSGDGTIDSEGKLRMLWNGVDTSTGGMIAMGTALVTYTLEGEPGDENYLKIESVNHNFRPDNPYSYGSTLWEDEDGHIYLYSATGNGNFLGNDPIVARTVGSELGGDWEYYYPDESGQMTWHREYPTQEQVQKSGIAPGQGSFVLPWVFKKGEKYFMCCQTFPFGREMAIMTSDHPWGPFKKKQFLIRFPNPLDALQGDKYGNQYRFLYMLNLHPALSREGELVISTNTDTLDSEEGKGDGFWRNFNNPGSADWYRPFFYRVYNWESLFKGTMAGATDMVEFTTADGKGITEPGEYKFVCEQGVFGDEKFETSQFAEGKANSRIEFSFTVGEAGAVESVEADANALVPVYYNLQGIMVENPIAGEVYIERCGTDVRKILWR